MAAIASIVGAAFLIALGIVRFTGSGITRIVHAPMLTIDNVKALSDMDKIGV